MWIHPEGHYGAAMLRVRGADMRPRLSKRWRAVKWVGMGVCIALALGRDVHLFVHRGQEDCVTPFSLVLLLFAVSTAYLFWRDRRYPRAHCQSCGYDLTGNTSGVCPECGQAVTMVEP
jgi:hypothetical protein